MWSELASLSIDYVQSFDHDGRTNVTRIQGTYLVHRPYSEWSTGKYYLEAPGLYGAVDPLMQGSNLYVKQDGVDLVATYLCYKGWFYVTENDFKNFSYLGEAVAEGDFKIRVAASYITPSDTKEGWQRWFLQVTDKWPDWRKYDSPR